MTKVPTWGASAIKAGVMRVCLGGAGPQPLDLPERETDQPIIGVRAWRVKDREDGPVLASVFRDCVWAGAELHAADGQPTLFEEEVDGINALHRFVSASRLIEAYSGARAIGEVELSGTVVVHEEGYRAERARIRRIWVLPRHKDATNTIWFVPIGYKEHDEMPPDTAQGYEWAQSMVGPLTERYECPVSVMSQELWDAHIDPGSVRTTEEQLVKVHKPEEDRLVERVTAGSFLDTMKEFENRAHW